MNDGILSFVLEKDELLKFDKKKCFFNYWI